MDIGFLHKSIIFRNINDDEIDSALSTLNAVEKKYKKDDIIMTAGDVTEKMGLVIRGSVTVESNDIWVNKLIFNLLQISAHKNLTLSLRSFHTAPKTVRGRIMAYLNSVSLQNHSAEFDIPFNRQQMADYLSLDRTALSKELGRMRNEGVILFRKNHFKIMG